MTTTHTEKKIIIVDGESAGVEQHFQINADTQNTAQELHVFVFGGGSDALRLNIEGVSRAPVTTLSISVTSVAVDAAHITVYGLCRATQQARRALLSFRHDGLLLSKTAGTISVPSLEIVSSETEARHAATIGSLDERNLYYLQTRGFSPAAARTFLVDGFFQRAIERIGDTKLESVVQERLMRFFSKI